MIEVPLTRGKVALVDEVDSYVLTGLRWQASREGSARRNWYAVHGGDRANGKRPLIRMHRVIMEHMLNRELNSSEHIDHINHDGLDNRRHNLRLATTAQNMHNSRHVITPTTSKYKGVTWNKHAKQWKAGIRVGEKKTLLGYFLKEEDAAKAYNIAAKKHFGEYAAINQDIIIDPIADKWILQRAGKPGHCDRCKIFAKFIRDDLVEGKIIRVYRCAKCGTETRKEA